MPHLLTEVVLETFVMIAGLTVMAIGIYLIVVFLFRLPFGILLRRQSRARLLRGEVVDLMDRTKSHKERQDIAA